MTFFFMFIARTVVLTEGFSCYIINLTKIHTIVKQCELRPCGSSEFDFDSGIV